MALVFPWHLTRRTTARLSAPPFATAPGRSPRSADLAAESRGQEYLFYAFNREGRVLQDHLLRNIDRMFDLSDFR